MRSDSKKSAATIYDVAELAGVSHITVSRVANGKANVSAKTRQRVLDAMQNLEYIPNPAAQALQSRRLNVIELVTTDIWGIGPDAITEILIAAKTRNYQVSVIPISLDQLYSTLSTISGRLVAGTLLFTNLIDLDFRTISGMTRDLPFVQIGGKLHSPLPSVTYDHYYAAQMATQHLIDLGHKHIAHLAGPQDILDGKLRHDGWLYALRSNGLTPGPVAFASFGEVGVRDAVKVLMESDQRFTAIFVASDRMALAFMYLLEDYGLQVPRDVSIVGYDNEALGQFVRPNLTSVTNDRRLLSTAAVDYLFHRIDDPQAPGHQRILTPELIIRASTQPPHAQD